MPACYVVIRSTEREAMRQGRYLVLSELRLGRLATGEDLLVVEAVRRETAVGQAGESGY